MTIFKRAIRKIVGIVKENWPLILILLLTTAIYSNSLFNGFVSDDSGMLPTFDGNPNRVFSRQHFSILNLSFFFNYLATGPSPFIFHLTNLFLYIVLISIVHTSIKQLWKGSENAITLLFATHPISSEAVSFISARSYLIYSSFFLLSIYFYLKWRNNRGSNQISLSLFFAALAYFSNPFASVIPVVIVIYELFFGDIKKTWKPILLFFFLTLLITGSFYLGRAASYQFASSQFYNIGPKPDRFFWEKVTAVPNSLAKYLNLFFLSEGLSFSHQNKTTPYTAVAITLLTTSVIIFLKRKASKSNLIAKAVVVLLLSSFVAVLPAFNPLSLNPTVAERYFLLSSLGLTAAYFLLLKEVIPNRIIRLAIILSLIILFSYKTYKRNFDWKSDKSLFLAATVTDPLSFHAHFVAGSELLKENKLDEAEAHLKTAILLVPDFFAAYLELGKVYYHKKDYSKSLESLRIAQMIKPNNFDTLVYLQLLSNRGYGNPQ